MLQAEQVVVERVQKKKKARAALHRQETSATNRWQKEQRDLAKLAPEHAKGLERTTFCEKQIKEEKKRGASCLTGLSRDIVEGGGTAHH